MAKTKTKEMKELIFCSDHDGTFSKIKPLLSQLEVVPYVITGRDKSELPLIKEKLNGTPIKGLYCYPGKHDDDLEEHLMKVATWKAKMVRKLKANVFVDDDHRVLREVSKMNPKTICLEVF